MLTDEELLRYSRQIMLPQFDIAAQEALKSARVLMVGVGGIGCPVAQYLAAAGVGELVLADFDEVEASNLQRQVLHTPADIGRKKTASAAQKIQAQNPWVKVSEINAALNASNLAGALENITVVVDGSDNFSTRDAVNTACVTTGVPLVSAAAIGLSAQLTVFDARRADSPCYRCLFPQADDAAPSCAEAGILASVVGVAGTLAATEALKIITAVGQPLVGRLWLWEADTAMMRTLNFKRDSACSVCSARKHT